jgi:hypothetical protein
MCAFPLSATSWLKPESANRSGDSLVFRARFLLHMPVLVCLSELLKVFGENIIHSSPPTRQSLEWPARQSSASEQSRSVKRKHRTSLTPLCGRRPHFASKANRFPNPWRSNLILRKTKTGQENCHEEANLTWRRNDCRLHCGGATFAELVFDSGTNIVSRQGRSQSGASTHARQCCGCASKSRTPHI